MSIENGVMGRIVPLVLITFLWASQPALSQTMTEEPVAGQAELTPEPVTDVEAVISDAGDVVTVSWKRSESDLLVTRSAGGITPGERFSRVRGVRDYNIWRQGADQAEPVLVGSVPAPDNDEEVLEFVDDSFGLGTTYIYSVSATAPAGEDPESPLTMADTAPIDVGPLQEVTLEVDPSSLDEDAGVATISVTASIERAWSLSTPVSLSISGGTAERAEGRDYTAEWADQEIIIPAGETEATATLSVSVNDDNLAGEGDESIEVQGESAVTAGVDVNPEPLDVDGTEITLIDNDVVPTEITLTLDTESLDEAAGETNINVTATLGDGSTALLNDTQVTLALSRTEESLGSDYTASDVTINIPAEETGASALLTITPNDDNLAGEGDETIEVSGAAEGFDPVHSAMITLTDNDVVPTEITLTLDTESLDEAAGETSINVTATLGDGSTALLNDTEVTLSLSGTEESLGADYTASDVTITVARGDVDGSSPLAITPNDDNLAGEGDETIEVSGAAEGFDPVHSAMITLTDNDVVPTEITLTLDTESLDEAAGETSINVTATLGDGSTALLNDTEVTLSLSGTEESLGADYTASDVTITVARGDVDGSSPLAITPNDDNLAGEGDETIEVSGAAEGFDPVHSAMITLTDNDAVPTEITLTLDTESLDEAAGETSINVTATLGDGSTALLNDTEVTLSLSGTEESLGADYTASDVTITVARGDVDGSSPLAITPNDDNLAGEGDETIEVSGAAEGFDPVHSAMITLTDNDAVPTEITLTLDTESLDEAAGETSINVTATLGDGSTALLNDTEVTLSLSGTEESLGADYTASDVTITVARGDVDGSSPLTITPNDDNLAGEGDETIEVSGAAEGFDPVHSAMITLIDNDVVPTDITLSVDPASLSEGAGATDVEVTATLGDGSTALLNDTQVAVSLSGTDEALGADYEASQLTVTVAAGATDGMGTLTLTPNDDNLAEGDETIEVSGEADGYAVASTMIALTDNDEAPDTITLEVDRTSVDEGAGETAVEVTATLGNGSTALLNDIQVTLSLSGTEESLGADYTASDVTITVAAGAVDGSSTLTLTPNDDNLAEGDETIEVSGAADGFAVESAMVTLADNDLPPALVVLTVDGDTFDEGAGEVSVTVTATLGDGSTAMLNDTQVQLSVDESDENAAASATVTIAAGETSGSEALSLTLKEENLVDGDKTIMLNGVAGDLHIDPVELTVTDNDVTPTSITLEVDNNTFDEGDGTAGLTVNATLGDGSTALLNDTEVFLQVDATDENEAASAAVMIAAGETSGSAALSLTLKEENLVDGDKTIMLMGRAAGFEIADVPLTVTDNDSAPTTITLSLDPDSFDEGSGRTSVTVTAVLGDGITALLNDTPITLSLSGTAEEGTDYNADVPTITVLAEQTSGTGVLVLTPPDELVPEYDETIVVEGSASGFTVTSATITLTDNDDEPTVVTPIPAMTLYVGGADGVVELSDKFRGLDMTYSATSSNQGVATVSVTGSLVTVSAVIEGESSIEVTAANTIGPDASQSFAVTVITEPNETQIVEDALAAIGRSTLSSVSSAIGTRFASRPGTKMMTVAGQSVLSKGGMAHLGARGLGLQNELRYAQATRNEMSWRQALRNTSFAVPVGESGGDGSGPRLPNWTLWGLGDYGTFEGTPDHGSHSGTLTTVYLGADKRVAERGQLGVAVSYSMGETDYDFQGDGASGSGVLTTVLTSVYPYVRAAPGKGMDIWALGGIGTGTVENERGVTSTTEESDLTLALGVVGARQSLGAMGGLDMALRGDAGMTHLTTAEGDGVIADQAAAAQRVRLGVEGAHTIQMSSCAKITPYGELSGRFDGGDGQTGGGLEAAGGLRYECPRSRFRFEARGRILALNSAYKESGGSVMASYSPGADGLGLSMALTPHWGATGGAQALWRDEAFRTIGRLGSSRDDWSMDAQVGYGMRVQSLPGVLTPFARFEPAGIGRSQMRLGVRFEGLRGTAFEMMDLDLSAGRVERRQRYAESRLDVRGAMYF